jgi:hypothetical protein
MRPEVVYHGRELRSSVLWLVIALFLGGSPLAVYFTTSRPLLSQLVLAAVLGLPLFALSLHDLGKSTGLVLDGRTRRLKYIKGFFDRRTARVYAYDQVREIHLTRNYFPNAKGAPIAYWHLLIHLNPKETLVLEEWSHEEAARRARYLGAAFGVSPRIDDETYKEVVMGPAPRLGIDRRFFLYLVFYGLGALVLVMSMIWGWARYFRA